MIRVTCVLIVAPTILLLLFWGWYQWRYWKILVVARRLPTALSPTPPILGHLYLAFFGIKHLVNRLVDEGKRISARGTKIVCCWFGPQPVFMVFKEDDARIVLTSSKTSEKSGEYRFVRFALGRGLLTAPGDIHKITRRYINPLFQHGNVSLLSPVFNRSANLIVEGLSQHVGGGQVNLLRITTPIILRNTAEGILGTMAFTENKNGEYNSLLNAMKSVTKIAINRVLKLWLWSDSIFEYLWSKEINEFFSCRDRFIYGRRKVNDDLNVKYNNFIKDDNKNTFEEDKSLQAGRRPRTIFDVYEDLQRTHPQFTDKDLESEMVTLMITGTDSSNITICSCLLALAAFPNIQEKVYEEVVAVTGKEDKDFSVEDINKLVYLDQVVKETLRKFSVSPIILRRVDADIKLSECTLPAGATVGVSIISLHHDPEVFTDPETFDPDRFSPSNTAKLKKYSYLPFSGGSRGCIGQIYATIFVKTVIAHVIRRYRLSTTTDINSLKFNIGVILYSSTGYKVLLHHRPPR